jgi:hypothetical protein
MSAQIVKQTPKKSCSQKYPQKSKPDSARKRKQVLNKLMETASIDF